MELSFDTDQGRAMLNKLLASHSQITRMVVSMQRTSESLIVSKWQAPAATQFNTTVAAWTADMQPTLDKLREARRRLEAEIREWEQTGQGFDVAAAAPANSIQTNADGRPVDANGMVLLDNTSNMSDLAAAVIQLNANNTPVRIVQTGENTYAVLIAGTDNFEGGNNWVNALNAGSGIPSTYMNEVKGLIQKLPEGATINLAGHSQGGLVALLLADDQGLNDRYRINSVTTFAASGNTQANSRVGEYHSFLTANDPMRGLEANPHGNWPGGNRILPTLPGAFGDPTVRPTIIPVAGGAPLIGGHSAYPDSPALKGLPLPFAIEQPWPTDGSGAYRATNEDNLTRSVRDLNSDSLFRRAEGRINMPVEGAKFGVNNLVLAPVDHALDSVFSHTPDPVRNTYDRGSDWLLNHVATGPTFTEAVGHTAGGAAEIVTAPVQGAWDVVSSVPNAGNDLIHGRFGDAAGELKDGVVDGVTNATSGLWEGAQDLGGGLLDTIL